MKTTEFPEIDTGDDDPLAGLGIDLEPEIQKIQADANETAMNRVAEFLKKPAEGLPLYLDIETIPDYSRFEAFELEPLPVMPPEDTQDQLLTADQFLSQTVPDIETWLSRHNPPREWLTAIIDAEKSAKARKGVITAFADHDKRIASIAGAEERQVKKMSVTPMMCRICSISWAVGGDKPVSIWAGDDNMMERHLLEMSWKMMSRCSQVIGFGVAGFDLPVIVTRSMILGVHPHKVIDRRRSGNADVLDLCHELYGSGWGDALGLKPTCRSLGIEPEADCDGSQVYKLFRAGKVDELRRYNESDVRLTQRLHREKMIGYFCV